MAEESKLECNGARGEVPLRIGDVDLVIAAEMGRLASVSSALECKSLQDLWQRLTGSEIGAVMAGVRFLAVRGDVDKAIAKLNLKHFKACAEAFGSALAHHFEDDEGNA